MRPLKLTIQAFASYGKKTDVDFTKPNQNLFLITGDTGAGKTTIFDAMVFAIYGEASSGNNKKDGAELQSQFVDYDTEPFVELLFSEKNGQNIDLYTVRRVPRHIRPLKRGKGVTDEKETVSLTMPDGREYSQNTQETDKKLKEIVGLTKEQFMQVAMIAQGEYMELLRAKSDDKKVIFRKLFNTQLFQNIVDELNRQCRDKKSEIARIRTEYQTEVGHAEIPDDYEEAENLRSIWERILSSDRLSIKDMENFLEGMKKFCDKLKKESDSAQIEYTNASKMRDEKNDAYVRGRQLLEFFVQLEEAQMELAECEAAENQICAAANLITKINAAYEIQAVYQRYVDAKREVEDRKKKLREQEAALPTLKAEYEDTVAVETAAKEEQEREFENFTKVSERVEKALEILQKIKSAAKEVVVKQQAYEQANEAAQQAKKKLTNLEEQEQEWKKQEEELGNAREPLAGWERKCEIVAGISDNVESIKTEQKNVSRQRNKVKDARTAYKEASRKYREKNAEYDVKHKVYFDAQAGILAKNLKEGDPCPVCGSMNHPNLCELSEEHQELTREMLDALAKEVSILNEKQQEKATEAHAVSELLEVSEKNLSDMLKRLREQMTKYIDNISEEMELERLEEILTNWKAAIQAEGIRLKSNRDRLDEVQNSLKGVDEKKRSLRDESEQAAQIKVNAETEFKLSKSELEGWKASIDYQTEEEAKGILKTAKEIKIEKDAAYEKAKDAAERAKTAKEKAETLIRKYKDELPEQKKERDSRKVLYKNILAEKEVVESEWEDITEKYEKAEVTRLQTKIQEHERKKAAADGKRDAAQRAIGNQKHPMLDVLQAEKEAAERQFKEAQAVFDKCKEIFKTNSKVYETLTPKMEKRSQIVQEYTRLDSLYNRLAGKITNARMDIETFVQRYYLERILYAANARFQDMSAGQYELRMYDIDKAGEGKNHGLDLMVYSTVTGKEREVRTFSGGESFMAALSLALGMADQIQENSASINLDIMFIDEGFGSLDDHSRNQAVKVLQQMAGSSRLIGIISHVTELKQEIEDQLLVSKDDSGSHVKWEIS